ncbi:MAG: Omp28-related outer membrane protein [Muribaculaceae bacterium]|nr:Omp28-related outer membrane protein [Muribaculaceae bacterium]
MKKSLLLLLAALMLPITVGAQPVQKIMGHYENDSINAEGATVTNSGTRSIAIILEPDELEIYQGGTITAIRVGLSEATLISKVFVIPVTANDTYGERTEWDCEMNAAGWNVFDLPTPYDINLGEDEKLLVGFYYQQATGINPLSFVKVGKAYDTYTYAKTGAHYKWKAMNTTDRGNLSLQCVVEKDSYPDYRITASNLRTVSKIQEGEMLPFVLDVHNGGIKQIDAGGLSLDVLIDGNLVANITNENPFINGYCTVEDEIPTAGLNSGQHTLAVILQAVDGVALETPIEQEVEFVSYKDSYPRQKHLVEQLTSTYCTYCPLGNSMLSILTSQRDDIIWVGIHGNLGSGVDPFRSNQADSIMYYMTGGSISYPSGAFDRTTGWDDEVNIVNDLGYYEQYHQMMADYLGDFFDYISDTNPTFAEIKADCSFNEDTRMATVSVHGKLSPDFDLMMGEDAKLTVYLTEDGLVAPQLNAGTWVNNYVHNGVFRKALGSIMGDSLNRYGGQYKNVYRFQVPNGWDWNKLNVVAFISRPMSNFVNGFTDMAVNNADVFKFAISNGVEEIEIDPNAVPVEYYDITGRQYESLQPGINIVKMSDGTTRKMLVK